MCGSTILSIHVVVIQKEFKGKGGNTAMRTLVQWDSPFKLQSWEDEQDF
jgi:hypothetical protein